MSTKLRLIFRLIVCLILIKANFSKVEFTNLKCTALDKLFIDFEYCFIKSVNRSYKYFSIKAKLLQTPVTKAKVNVLLKKRFNGYRPFLYTFTVDSCRFMRNRTSNPIANYFFGFLETYTNLNHTCPYTTDLIFDKVNTEYVDHKVSRVLPFPKGDYSLESTWLAYDKNVALLVVYVNLS